MLKTMNFRLDKLVQVTHLSSSTFLYSKMRYGKKKSLDVPRNKVHLRKKKRKKVKCDATLWEKKYFRAPFLVLQVVTNSGLYSVPGRTK